MYIRNVVPQFEDLSQFKFWTETTEMSEFWTETLSS